MAEFIQQQRCRHDLPLFRPAALRQAGQPGDDLLVDLLQLRRQLRHADGLEQIGDDPVLDAGLRVFKIVIPAQERHLQQRLHGLGLPGQRRAGDERHLDVGQQKVRLELLHQLQDVYKRQRPSPAHS